MTKKELLEMLKDPEVNQALKKQSDDELEGLLKGIDISEDDTIETISKKHQDQLAKLVKYFNTKVESVKTETLDEAKKPQVEAENRKIQEFAKANPGMNSKDVVDAMQPLYDSGKSIEVAYAMACRAVEVNPETGVALADEAKGDKKDKSGEKKETLKSSKKSGMEDEPPAGEEEEEEKDTTGKSLEEIIAANQNAFEAKHGNPFADKT